MNGLRIEFQDQVNFVILDWDIPEDHAFGTGLGMTNHPNFLSIAPNSNEVVRGLYAVAEERRAAKRWWRNSSRATAD